jgi:transcription elongation factor GreA
MSTLRDASPQEYKEMIARREAIVATMLPSARAVLDESSAEAKADWYDRAAYDAALEDVLALERELEELDDHLAEARVITPTRQRPERAGVGTTVMLRDLSTGTIDSYDLVASVAFHGEGEFITAHSPLGRRLLGCRSGQIIEVDAPIGHEGFRVEDVTSTDVGPAAPGR